MTVRTTRSLFPLVCTLLFGAMPTQDPAPSIVPRPARMVPGTGRFIVGPETTIAVSDTAMAELRDLADLARTIVEDATGIAPRLTQHSAEALPNQITLALSSTPDSPAEGYRLVVTGQSVAIEAPAPAGLFYGLQTLRQLLAPAGTGATGSRVIHAITIEDAPRFPYRGMHLDVGRHFFPLAFIERYIDLLARYKFNTFHWHLTEDQGWRIEILKYPRLTSVGSRRRETVLEKHFDPYVGDRIPYGGYYTQDEVRHIVAYAARRYVTVIPEIEMPGHSTAALAAYPELACTEGPFEVATRWGVHPDIYCPSEHTFAFLEDVLTEVMDLFPGRYIHIGGDEAPKTRWEESATAQDVMRREGLADEHELQSYFIRRIERFLRARGRRLIGWDEILEGGLAPEATVMSWRGIAGGIAAAREGHDVIMTPTSHVYFDYYQGDPAFEPLAIGGRTTLERVYEFEPVPEVLTAAEAAHVLGAQGNVWTEYMRTSDYVEYMVFPRMLALAEVVWSPAAVRDWDDFTRRLPAQFEALDALGVKYRVPPVEGLAGDRLTLDDSVTVTLGSVLPDDVIRYTTDGSDPVITSPRYESPIVLPASDTGTIVTARVFRPNGAVSPAASARYVRATLREPLSVDVSQLVPGARVAYYEGRFRSVDELAAGTPARSGVASRVTLQGFERDEQMGLVFEGLLRVPTDGIYTFTLTSDDGSALDIGDERVIDHDGLHGATDRSGMIALRAGSHPLRVSFFQAGGGVTLALTVTPPDATEPRAVDAWLYHRP